MNLVKRKVEELNDAVYNPRDITEEELKGLEGSIDRFGYVEPIVWNKRTGNIVGGHQRLKVLKNRGRKVIEVIEVDLDLMEEKALNITLNNPETQGKYNKDKLVLVMTELKLEFPEYQKLKMDTLELEEFGTREKKKKEEKEEPEDIGETEPEPISRPGDLWIMGDHRLLVGEKEPGYCDTIVSEWQKHTKKNAVLSGSKHTFSEVVEVGGSHKIKEIEKRKRSKVKSRSKSKSKSKRAASKKKS